MSKLPENKKIVFHGDHSHDDDFPFYKADKVKTHWDCMKCDGHGVIIRNNVLVNCEACGSDF